MAGKVSLTTEQIGVLIGKVRSCPCIWDQEHVEKVHRSKVAHVWAEISSQMNLPDDYLRAEWKNLRDLFMEEVQKVNLTSIKDYRGQWIHFKSLSFLYRLHSERVTSEDNASDITDVYVINDEPSVKLETSNTNINQIILLDDDQECTPLSENRTRTGEYESTRDDLSAVNPEAPKRRRMTQPYTEEDFDKMFLMSLTPYFKQLKPIRKLELRNRIQETIIKEIERTTANNSSERC